MKPISQHSRLERGIQTGLLVLLAGMPFHAFLSVWLGSLTGYQAVIQSWKDVLLAGLAVATVLLIKREPSRIMRLRQPWVTAAIVFIVITLLVTLVTRPPLTGIIYGLKTDFEFGLAALIAVLVASRSFMHRASLVLVVAAGLVATFGAAELLFLPRDFLSQFGYSPLTIAPYLTISGSDTIRYPATLGGPNQLGTFLILPLCICLSWLVRGHNRGGATYVLVVGLLSLFATYSRGAWVGAAVALGVCLLLSVTPRQRRYIAGAIAIIGAAALLALPGIINRSQTAQHIFLHSSIETYNEPNRSDTQHALSIQNNTEAVIENPLGHGLGTAGPATFYTGMPHIIENQYLQIGYESGVLGMLAFLAVVGLLGVRLMRQKANQLVPTATAAALIGISVTALVLPSWADSTTAITVWLVAGLAAGEHASV